MALVHTPTAEEHRHTEPLSDPVGAVSGTEGYDEDAAGHEPEEDVGENCPVLFARHVRDRIQSHDRGERRRRERHPREVSLGERRIRDVPPRPVELRRGDVDTDDVEALCQPFRRRDARATAEVEHASAVRHAQRQIVEISVARIGFDPGAPLGVTLSECVVPGLDDRLSRVVSQELLVG